MKSLLFLIIVSLCPLKGFCLSLDIKVPDKKIITYSSFDEAKHKGFIDGNFYRSENEKVFEALKLTRDLSGLGEECTIKSSLMGYQEIDRPLFVHSMPAVSAIEFSKILSSLNYTYTITISLVFEFSNSCKKNKNSPDVVVINS